MRKMSYLAFAMAALVFSMPGARAQDYAAKIEALEKQLEAAKENIRKGQETVTLIEGELTDLKNQVASDKPASDTVAGQASPAIASAEPAADATVSGDADEGRPVDSAASAMPERGMQGSINPLRESKNYLTGQDLLDESFPGSWAIPGTGVRLAIRGYAKLDFIQDFDYVGDRFEFYVPTIPVEGSYEASLDGRNTMHAKESRISFDFRKTVERPNGDQYPLQAFLELDFFDDRETFKLQPRLRHAYGVLGRFLAGQTWATSADLSVLAGTIDFDSGDALYGDRIAQVRFADRLNKTTTWAIALEENKSEVGNPFGFDGQSRQKTPSLAGYLRWTDGRAHLGLGYDIMSVNWQGGDTGPSDSALGWGVALTGRYLLGAKSRNAISGQVTYGEGSAFRVISLTGSGVGAVLKPDGNIKTLPHWSVYAAYNHYWTDSLNSSFVLARAEADSSYLLPGSAIKRASTAHVNLIWFPYKSVSTGIEMMWGERENQDGSKGNATRSEAMVKYKFN